MRMCRRLGISPPNITPITYIWSKYGVTTTVSYIFSENEFESPQYGTSINASEFPGKYGTSYTHDDTTGTVTLTGTTGTVTYTNPEQMAEYLVGKWFMYDYSKSWARYVYSCVNKEGDEIYYDFTYTKETNYSTNTVYSKNTSDYIGTVESTDIDAYPTDGNQGDYWYTRLTVLYTWDVYNVIAGSGYTQSQSSISYRSLSANTFYYASAYTFNSNTGIYTLTSYTAEAISDSYTAKNLKNNYVVLDSSSGSVMYYVADVSYYSNGVQCYASAFTAVETTSDSKGDISYGTVTSYNSSAYPTNGKQDGYWYVKRT